MKRKFKCKVPKFISTTHIFYKKNVMIRTNASIFKDIILFLSKTALSITAVSVIMFANALYSAGMGGARYIASKIHMQSKEKQVKSYQLVGFIICCASGCYVLYVIRLFYGGSSGIYNMNIALIIALYTFIECGNNIREAWRLRNSHRLDKKAIRAIRFAAMFLCFALTQTAIMSFASPVNNNISNALGGVVFGSLALLVGVFVMLDSRKYKMKNPVNS